MPGKLDPTVSGSNAQPRAYRTLVQAELRRSVTMPPPGMRWMQVYPPVDRLFERVRPTEPEMLVDFPNLINRITDQFVERNIQNLMWRDKRPRHVPPLENRMRALEAFLAQICGPTCRVDNVWETHNHTAEGRKSVRKFSVCLNDQRVRKHG